MGRFISKDPIGFKSGDVNFYRYVNNNPIRFVDSFGLKAGDVCPNIVMKRKNINKTGDDKYGHWWTELGGNESYGWWPKKPVGLIGTLFGVPGELNATFFGGDATRDPHHGDPAEEVFNARISSSEECKCKTCDEAADYIRNFANSYSGSWSWPFGQNCRSFQESAMSSCCLER